MRDAVLMSLMDRLIADAGFRARARADLNGALQAEGFALQEDELSAVRDFHRHAAELSDDDLTAVLANPARRQQFGGA